MTKETGFRVMDMLGAIAHVDAGWMLPLGRYFFFFRGLVCKAVFRDPVSIQKV